MKYHPLFLTISTVLLGTLAVEHNYVISLEDLSQLSLVSPGVLDEMTIVLNNLDPKRGDTMLIVDPSNDGRATISFLLHDFWKVATLKNVFRHFQSACLGLDQLSSSHALQPIINSRARGGGKRLEHLRISAGAHMSSVVDLQDVDIIYVPYDSIKALHREGGHDDQSSAAIIPGITNALSDQSTQEEILAFIQNEFAPYTTPGTQLMIQHLDINFFGQNLNDGSDDDNNDNSVAEQVDVIEFEGSSGDDNDSYEDVDTVDDLAINAHQHVTDETVNEGSDVDTSASNGGNGMNGRNNTDQAISKIEASSSASMRRLLSSSSSSSSLAWRLVSSVQGDSASFSLFVRTDHAVDPQTTSTPGQSSSSLGQDHVKHVEEVCLIETNPSNPTISTYHRTSFAAKLLSSSSSSSPSTSNVWYYDGQASKKQDDGDGENSDNNTVGTSAHAPSVPNLPPVPPLPSTRIPSPSSPLSSPSSPSSSPSSSLSSSSLSSTSPAFISDSHQDSLPDNFVLAHMNDVLDTSASELTNLMNPIPEVTTVTNNKNSNQDQNKKRFTGQQIEEEDEENEDEVLVNIIGKNDDTGHENKRKNGNDHGKAQIGKEKVLTDFVEHIYSGELGNWPILSDQDLQDKTSQQVHELTYGEITLSSLSKVLGLVRAYDPEYKQQVFYDIGSGAGKVVLSAFLSLLSKGGGEGSLIKKAVGVEISQARFSKACQALKRMGDSPQLDEIIENSYRREQETDDRLEQPNYFGSDLDESRDDSNNGNTNTDDSLHDNDNGEDNNKSEAEIVFYKGDLRYLDIADADIIYMCSTCFGPELMQVIMQQLSTVKVGTRLIALTALPSVKSNSLTSLWRLALRETMPMSWGDDNEVWLYEKINGDAAGLSSISEKHTFEAQCSLAFTDDQDQPIKWASHGVLSDGLDVNDGNQANVPTAEKLFNVLYEGRASQWPELSDGELGDLSHQLAKNQYFLPAHTQAQEQQEQEEGGEKEIEADKMTKSSSDIIYSMLSYDEMPFSSVDKALELANFQDGEVFIDLGSGVGRVAIAVFMLRSVRQVVGVEVASSRHRVACTVLNRFASTTAPNMLADGGQRQAHAKIDLYHGDLRQFSLADADLVYISSAHFGDSTMRQIIQSAQVMKLNSRLITLIPLSEEHQGLTSDEWTLFRKAQMELVSGRKEVYFYRKDFRGDGVPDTVFGRQMEHCSMSTLGAGKLPIYFEGNV